MEETSPLCTTVVNSKLLKQTVNSEGDISPCNHFFSLYKLLSDARCYRHKFT